MKRKDYIALFGNLKKLGGLKGVKFAYAVEKNKNLLKQEVESVQEAIKPLENFQEYDAKRMKLAEQYAEKDEKGKAKTRKLDNGVEEYVITDLDAFNKDFEALKEENKSVLEERDAQIDEGNRLLDEEITIELYKIKLADVPEDITGEQMETVYQIIEE